MVKKFHILDCTLRDGGYYNFWDFNDNVVSSYVEAMNHLPIDYLEIGYRNNPSDEYLGKFGYTPVPVLQKIRNQCTKKLALMINEKSTLPADLDSLLKPVVGMVDMIRIAIDPKNIDRAVVLAKAVKNYGFEVGFNVMYMSTWLANKEFIEKLSQINGVAELFCMVDSFGGITPNEVKKIISIVRSKTTCPIGFHGHNNLQMSLINTLTAIECGVDYVDATILGMGRGAGNLNMELLLTYLNKDGLEVDFNVLGDVITTFTPLYEKYRWGTQLPYMISGANSIPQKEVMALVTNRVYSFDSIVRGLQNRKDKVLDNAKYPLLHSGKYEMVLIIGGGSSPIEHFESICSFISKHDSIAIVFATARHAGLFKNVDVPKYYCLVGREAKRLAHNIRATEYKDKCILPPYPRKLGTDVPEYAKNSTYELSEINFTDSFHDSCTTLAIQTAINVCIGDIFIVGYDGYPGDVLSEKEVALTSENNTLFKDYERYNGVKMNSLTPTLYLDLNIKSIYQYI